MKLQEHKDGDLGGRDELLSHYTVEKPRFWNDLVLFCQPLKFNFLPRAPDLVLSPTVLIEAALSLLSLLSSLEERTVSLGIPAVGDNRK